MALVRTALSQQAGVVLGLVLGAALFGGGFVVALTVLEAGASHGGDGTVHACVSRYTGQARFMLPGRPPACSASEVLMELGSGAAAADVEARLTALEAQVPDCLSDAAGTALFSGCDVQIVNGLGGTTTTNGTGNLIVGYNENFISAMRGGSHNLVIGMEHEYLSYGGLVAGSTNTISGPFSSVSGGALNTASGSWSSVSGGEGNMASGPISSVSGGDGNTASDSFSSVSGGDGNTASGPYSSVSGGEGNMASGPYSSVSGGSDNTASAPYSSVGGGLGLNADNGFEFLP